MNYKAFYRTYRPKNFNEVVGQEHIVKTLINILKLNKISHGYLFSGPRGTGKTSIARIFANALNCIHSESPEQICSSCLNNSQKSLDVIEIDAASNNSVNDIRIIREQVSFSPTNHPYKIYIIDEVHMLSKSAFNSLLMTLEEPPKHAIFILATTDPDKIPETIISRVQRYNFKRISRSYLKNQLIFVLKNEGIDFDNESIELIASLANGSLRDALSIADQISAYSNSKITKESLIEIFGLVSIDSQIQLISKITNKEMGSAIEFFNKLIEKGIDVTKLVSSLISLLKDFVVYKKTNNASLIESTDENNILKLNIKVDSAYDFIAILTDLLKEIKYSDIPQQLFQLTIIKLCSINSINPNVGVEKKISSIEQTQPIETKTNIFDDLGTISEIDVNLFVKKENEFVEKPSTKKEQTNTMNISIQHNSDHFNSSSTMTSEVDEKTLLSDFNTNEIKKRFDDIELASTSNQINDITINKTQVVDLDNTISKKDFDTDELIKKTTDILNVSNENEGIVNEVNEEILDVNNENKDTYLEKTIYDTNEINVSESHKTESFSFKNSTTEEISKHETTNLNPTIGETKEFDIKTEKNLYTATLPVETINKPSSHEEYKLTQPNIINLFVCAEKDTFDLFKEKLAKAINDENEKYSLYTTLLKETKFVCSANNYILVSSNDDWVINDLNDFQNEDKFNKFISEHFGNGINFFAITKQELTDSKNILKELKESNNMPRKYNIPSKNSLLNNQGDEIDDEHLKTEMKAKALFGSLFKKK